MNDSDYKFIQKRRLLYDGGQKLYEWLRNEGAEYKASNNIRPISLMDYYTTKEDIEIAAIVETLIPESLSLSSYKRMLYITELHNIIGDSPARLVRNRNFLHILPSKAMESILGDTMGVQKSSLFNLLDWIWDILVKRNMPLELAFGISVGAIRNSNIDVPDITECINAKPNIDSINMCLLRLCTNGGVGKGLWSSIDAKDITCPTDAKLIKLVRMFYPLEQVRRDSINEILSYIGFETPCEFVYSYWALYDRMDKFKDIQSRLNSYVSGRMLKKTWHNDYQDGFAFVDVEREKPNGTMARVCEHMRNLKFKKLKEEKDN